MSISVMYGYGESRGQCSSVQSPDDVSSEGRTYLVLSEIREAIFDLVERQPIFRLLHLPSTKFNRVSRE